MSKTQFDENGNFLGSIPKQAVEDCCHQGQCDDDVAHWRKELDFEVPRDMAIGYLSRSGISTLEELAEMSEDEIAESVLWLACWDVREKGDWFGLSE